MPDSYSVALVSLIAANTRITPCITDRAYIPADSICIVIKTTYSTLIPLCVRRNCIAKKTRTILVESVYIGNSINQVYNFLNRYGSKLQAVYVIYGNHDQIQTDLEKISEEKPSVKILITSRLNKTLSRSRKHSQVI